MANTLLATSPERGMERACRGGSILGATRKRGLKKSRQRRRAIGAQAPWVGKTRETDQQECLRQISAAKRILPGECFEERDGETPQIECRARWLEPNRTRRQIGCSAGDM